MWYQYEPIQVYNILGEYEKALALIEIGLKHNESYAELHYEAALAYQGLGQNHKALSEVNLALKYDPGFKTALILLDQLRQ